MTKSTSDNCYTVIMIELKNVSRYYGKGQNRFAAVKDVSLTIHKGETVAIVGKSGSGKSTILHLMVGLDAPSEGTVSYNGADIFNQNTDVWRGEKVGIVFQQFFLQNSESVLNNVALPLKIRGMKRKNRKSKALKSLQAVGLEDKVDQKTNDLSGGQKQRVAIARAIISNPELLVTDEPTGNLDSANGKVVEDILFDLNKRLGSTLVIVTHDLELAKRCSRVIHIKDGEIVQELSAKKPKARL